MRKHRTRNLEIPGSVLPLLSRSSLDCSCFAAPKSFTGTEQDALPAGDAEFEAGRNPPRQFDEMCSCRRRTNFAGGLFEQRQPAVEMTAIDRQWRVLGHRRAVVAARHQ